MSTVPASTNATSDATGAFKLVEVPVGSYSVVAAKSGYGTSTLAGVGRNTGEPGSVISGGFLRSQPVDRATLLG